MRMQTNLSLAVDTTADLRSLADEVGAPIGELADLLLRSGLKRADKAKLREWATKLPHRKGRLGGGLKGAQKAALEAINKLKAMPHAGKVFSVVEIARAAGLLVKATFDALRALEARGGFVLCVTSPDLDRWGRPAESMWWLEGDNLHHVAQDQVLEAVVTLREELALRRVEPLAVALIERACRLSAGWSSAALRLPQGEALGEGQAYDVSGEGAVEWLRSRWPVSF